MTFKNDDKKGKFKKVLISVFFLFILIVLGFYYSFYFNFPIYDYNSNLSAHVTRKKILSIKIGMSQSDVVKIIGKPLSTNKSVYIADDKKVITTIWSYHYKVSNYLLWWPSLWVHFDKDRKLISVYAKRKGPWFEESAFYSINKDGKYDFINDKMFSSTILR